MSKTIKGGYLVVFLLVSGCAHIDFGGDGMTYYDPKPYLYISTTKDCVTTAMVLVIPEAKKVMKFVPGYGSSELSATLSNGMIASVGQKSDTKIPETITSIAALGTAAAGALKVTAKAETEAGKQIICTPTARLYPVVSGKPDLENALNFHPTKEIVDLNKRTSDVLP